MKIYIYIYTNISDCKEKGFSYIGVSKDPDGRCSQHLKANTYFGNKLRKYDFDFDILDVAESYEEAYELEKAYIEEVNTQWPNGYNIQPGGEGGIHSSEHIEKIRKAKKGKKHSPDTIEKIRKTMTGKKHSPKTIKKMRKVQKESQNRPEVNLKRRCAMLGKTLSTKGKTWEEIYRQGGAFVRRMDHAIRRLEKKYDFVSNTE